MKKFILLMLMSVPSLAQGGYQVVGNNDNVVSSYNKNKQNAKNYLDKVLAENKRSNAVYAKFRKEGLNPEVPAQGRRFGELGDQGHKLFGDSVFVEPFGRCGSVGENAGSYWQARISNAFGLNTSKEMMNQSIKDCQAEISTPPEPTLTIKAPGEIGHPPFKGCLVILDVTNQGGLPTWTCPKDIVRQ